MRTRDALLRKAQAGHVAGGMVYGYENVGVFAETRGADGRPRRSHVIRRINPSEAAVVRELFQGYVAGRGLTRLAKSAERPARATPTWGRAWLGGHGDSRNPQAPTVPRGDCLGSEPQARSVGHEAPHAAA
jgi:hypothetical protein